jgi:hypothetical protein
MPTLHLHYAYIAPTLHLHCTYIMPTLHLHCTYIMPTLHLHCTYIMPTLHLHCTYIMPTLHLHCFINKYYCIFIFIHLVIFSFKKYFRFQKMDIFKMSKKCPKMDSQNILLKNVCLLLTSS